MRNDIELKAPLLVAAWPGIGHVAMTAGYFLVSKLQMHAIAAPGTMRLFDLEYVLVKDGKVLPLEPPRIVSICGKTQSINMIFSSFWLKLCRPSA